MRTGFEWRKHASQRAVNTQNLDVTFFLYRRGATEFSFEQRSIKVAKPDAGSTSVLVQRCDGHQSLRWCAIAKRSPKRVEQGSLANDVLQIIIDEIAVRHALRRAVLQKAVDILAEQAVVQIAKVKLRQLPFTLAADLRRLCAA